jgi:hypothetical protein
VYRLSSRSVSRFSHLVPDKTLKSRSPKKLHADFDATLLQSVADKLALITLRSPHAQPIAAA